LLKAADFTGIDSLFDGRMSWIKTPVEGQKDLTCSIA
jgi:hypothetical protein